MQHSAGNTHNKLRKILFLNLTNRALAACWFSAQLTDGKRKQMDNIDLYYQECCQQYNKLIRISSVMPKANRQTYWILRLIKSLKKFRLSTVALRRIGQIKKGVILVKSCLLTRAIHAWHSHSHVTRLGRGGRKLLQRRQVGLVHSCKAEQQNMSMVATEFPTTVYSQVLIYTTE